MGARAQKSHLFDDDQDIPVLEYYFKPFGPMAVRIREWMVMRGTICLRRLLIKSHSLQRVEIFKRSEKISFLVGSSIEAGAVRVKEIESTSSKSLGRTLASKERG